MSHATTHPFHDLDAKRIAATAATIAVHVFAVMLLLAPVQWTPEPKAVIEEPTTQLVEEIKEPKPIDPPKEEPKPVPVKPQAQPQRQAVPDAPPLVSDEQGALDFAYEPTDQPPADNTFEPPAPAGPVTLAMRVFPAPNYPARELRMGITGRVMLRVEVDAEGNPVSVTIERSSGNSALDKVAKETVLRKWKFVPAQRNGVNIPATGLVPIDFVLD
jgi:protein TonB